MNSALERIPDWVLSLPPLRWTGNVLPKKRVPLGEKLCLMLLLPILYSHSLAQCLTKRMPSGMYPLESVAGIPTSRNQGSPPPCTSRPWLWGL